MEDVTVAAVRRIMLGAVLVLGALVLVLMFVALRGSGQSKAERLHAVRSVSLGTTSCSQWYELSEDVRWISAYRDLSTRRYEGRNKNSQPKQQVVDDYVERISRLCSVLPESGTADDAADQAISEDPSLLAL